MRKLGPWFHQIELPGGILTKTESYFGEDADHPRPTWEHVKQVFPENLAGKSVLDVGCNAGFYSFAALERGADSVLGVDAVRWQVQQARFAAKAKAVSNARFQRASLYELDPQTHGTFDVVLALGLLYHLKHLVAGLERLFALTEELLIVESAVIATVDFGIIEQEPFLRSSDQLYLLAYPKNSPWVKESAFNWFFPTPGSLKAMLEDVGFIEVQIADVFFNRCLITARKPTQPIDSRYPAYLRASLSTKKGQWRARPGESLQIPLEILNSGHAVWRSASEETREGAVMLVVKLFSEEDPVFGQELPSRPLDRDYSPGDSWNTFVRLEAPQKPGSYLLEIDLVSENVAAFQDVGSKPLELTLTVEEPSLQSQLDSDGS